MGLLDDEQRQAVLRRLTHVTERERERETKLRKYIPL